MIENIPQLGIEENEDGTVTLEQDWSGNVDRVTVHPLHLRLIAERMGLVREVSASEADMVRVVTTAARRMRLLHDRERHLHELLTITAGAGREDLDYELTFCGATLDLLDEFVEDLAEPVTRARAESRQVTPAAATTRDGTPAPGTGGKPMANPDETQRVPAGKGRIQSELLSGHDGGTGGSAMAHATTREPT